MRIFIVVDKGRDIVGVAQTAESAKIIVSMKRIPWRRETVEEWESEKSLFIGYLENE